MLKENEIKLYNSNFIKTSPNNSNMSYSINHFNNKSTNNSVLKEHSINTKAQNDSTHIKNEFNLSNPYNNFKKAYT